MTVKDEIIAKSVELFAKEGYENTGVSRIVAEVGVTKPSLYHHFGSKEGLLSSVLEVYGNQFIDIFKEELHYSGDLSYAIDQFVIAYIRYVKRYPMFFRLYKQLYQSPIESDSYRIVKPFYKQLLLRLELFFTEVAKHHTNLKTKTTWMSYSLLGLIDTYIIHHMTLGSLEDLEDEKCRQVVKQFLYGVFA